MFWNETDHCWKDFDIIAGHHLEGFFASSVVPLLLGTHRRSVEDLSLFVQYMARQLNYQCGIPTSDHCSGLQWDFPNSWAPLQHAIVGGMENIANVVPEAGDLAKKLVKQWLNCNYCGWKTTGGPGKGLMFEKYDVNRMGIPGHGGEYVVQVGFGWTNGVALEFLAKYGRDFVPTYCHESPSKNVVEESKNL